MLSCVSFFLRYLIISLLRWQEVTSSSCLLPFQIGSKSCDQRTCCNQFKQISKIPLLIKIKVFFKKNLQEECFAVQVFVFRVAACTSTYYLTIRSSQLCLCPHCYSIKKTSFSCATQLAIFGVGTLHTKGGKNNFCASKIRNQTFLLLFFFLCLQTSKIHVNQSGFSISLWTSIPSRAQKVCQTK